MKYKANPVIVDAFRVSFKGKRPLALDNGSNAEADERMRAGYEPVIGDYWVVQEDGYVYVSPKEVFERKYSAV